LYTFRGTYKAIHGIYLYGLKFVGLFILIFYLYRWIFGNGNFLQDVTIIIQESQFFIFPIIIMLILYFSILLIIGSSSLEIDSKQITIRYGRWMKKLISFSGLVSINYVEHTVKGHEIPCIGLKTNSNQLYFVNIISYEKDIQFILSLLIEKANLPLDDDLEELRTTDSVKIWIKDKQVYPKNYYKSENN